MPYPMQNALQNYQNPSFKSVRNPNSGFSQFLLGSPGGIYQAPKLTGSQFQGLEGLLQGGQNQLQNPYNNPRSQQAINRFHSQTIPSIAERFLGSGNERNSSSFQGALGSAGAGLEQGLASDSLQQALQMLQLGLGTQAFDTGEAGSEEGLLQSLFKGSPEIISALSKILPFFV